MEKKRQAGPSVRVSKGIKNNLVSVLLAVLLTGLVTVVGWSITRQEIIEGRVRVCEKDTALNSQNIEKLCKDVEKTETTMVNQLASLEKNVDRRLTSLETTIGLLFKAVTGDNLQEEE